MIEMKALSNVFITFGETMKFYLQIVSLVLMSFAPYAQAASSDAVFQNSKQALAKLLDCSPASKDPWRHWCAVAAMHKQSPAALDLPKAPKALVGLSLEIPADAAVNSQLLADRTSLSSLILGPSGAKVMYLKPSNPEEQKELAYVTAQVAAVLKNFTKDKNIQLSAGLQGYLTSLTQKPLHPITIKGTMGSFGDKLPTQIYRMKTSAGYHIWVAVEEAKGGIYLSVFPD